MLLTITAILNARKLRFSAVRVGSCRPVLGIPTGSGAQSPNEFISARELLKSPYGDVFHPVRIVEKIRDAYSASFADLIWIKHFVDPCVSLPVVTLATDPHRPSSVAQYLVVVNFAGGAHPFFENEVYSDPNHFTHELLAWTRPRRNHGLLRNDL